MFLAQIACVYLPPRCGGACGQRGGCCQDLAIKKPSMFSGDRGLESRRHRMAYIEEFVPGEGAVDPTTSRA